MKKYFPYILQSIPLLLALLLSGLLPEFHLTSVIDIQFHDTYVVIQRWEAFMLLFLVIGHIMNLLIAFINKLNKISYNILFLLFNTSILIFIVYTSSIIVYSHLQDSIFDKMEPDQQQLINSILSKTITNAVIIFGIFLLMELFVLYKTIRLKRAVYF
ncbi:MAG: hypothetical protein NVV82_14140 [Sporocytophaga sp.]|nr:hypothetical protein [Sporocytophaga sp.]